MKTIRMIITILISLVWVAAASALDVKLQWDPNTESDLAGYKVYYGVDSLASPAQLDVNNQTVATISGLDPAQNYSFAVAAYNTSGLESPYSNVITALESVLPTVSISNPSNNAKVSNTVDVRASASDNVGVIKVEYFVNGTLKAADTAEPYQYSWDTLAVAPGTYSIVAKAYDAAGNVGLSTVSVNVVNDVTPPTVSYTAPLQGSSVSGSVTVSSIASDDVGVTRVEFYVNGAMGAAVNAAPYNYLWNTKTVPNGSYSLTAKAYDAANHVTTSSAVTVTVNNPVSDTTAPTVSISAPANGATVNGTVSVSATASDNVGVTKVEFYVNGTLKATDTASPYAYSWDTTSATNGSYTLMAKAYDAAGNLGQSSTVTVTVNNPVTDTTPPVTSITSPATGATVNGTVSIAASTADNMAVTKVELYVNGALCATDTTAPFGFSWDTTAIADGAYDLTTKAYDAAGNVGQSATVSVNVSNLAVTILNPTDGSTTSGTTTVTTSTKGKGVSKVDFYINGKLHETKTTAKVTAASVTTAESAPYSFTWDTTALANGSYTLTAVAYDSTGKTVQSTPVTAVVSNPVATAAIKGDANGDGAVTVADALVVLKAATDPALLTEAIRTRSDVAPLDAAGKPLGDGVINISDALLTLRKAVGLVQW